jgi:hypothetical protein
MPILQCNFFVLISIYVYREQYVAKLWDTVHQEFTRERAVWGAMQPDPLDKWKLDATEGRPNRDLLFTDIFN